MQPLRKQIQLRLLLQLAHLVQSIHSKGGSDFPLAQCPGSQLKPIHTFVLTCIQARRNKRKTELKTNTKQWKWKVTHVIRISATKTKYMYQKIYIYADYICRDAFHRSFQHPPSPTLTFSFFSSGKQTLLPYLLRVSQQLSRARGVERGRYDVHLYLGGLSIAGIF